MNKFETIGFAITVISFCGSVLFQVWKVSSSVSDMKHGLEKQDIRLENLNDVQALAFNGFRERIDHAITRVRSEVQTLDNRTEGIENFLVKTTAFEKRQ